MFKQDVCTILSNTQQLIFLKLLTKQVNTSLIYFHNFQQQSKYIFTISIYGKSMIKIWRDLFLYVKQVKLSCYLVYPASKSLMTIRHCFRHADLVSYSSFYIFSNISVSLRNHIIFSTSQFFPSSAPMSP